MTCLLKVNHFPLAHNLQTRQISLGQPTHTRTHANTHTRICIKCYKIIAVIISFTSVYPHHSTLHSLTRQLHLSSTKTRALETVREECNCTRHMKIIYIFKSMRIFATVLTHSRTKFILSSWKCLRSIK